MVADICQGPSHSNPYQLTPCNDELYFVAIVVHDEWLKPTVCRFAGNKVTPVVPDPSITWSLDVRDMTAFQDAVYFWAYHDEHGVELWKCKGLEIGMVENYCPDDRINLLPDILTPYKEALYLQSSGPSHCADLCRLQNGKIAYLSHLGKNCLSIPRPRFLGKLSDTLYFLVDLTHRKSDRFTSPPLYETAEIWRFDGGSMRQFALLEKNERVPTDRFHSQGAELNGYIFFGLGDADHGGELWRTDEKQAVLHADIWEGKKGSNPDEFLLLNGKLFFLASDGENGRQLWQLSAE
jgi:ELWxxDGT repeat protein